MLQEKKRKTLSVKCLKFVIILLLIISGFSGFIFGWIILGIYFYIINLGIKGGMGIGDIFEHSGLNGCLSDLMGNLKGIEDKIDNDYKEKYKKIKNNKKVREFLEKLNKIKNIKDKQRKISKAYQIQKNKKIEKLNSKLSTEGFNPLKNTNLGEEKKSIISFNDNFNSKKNTSSFNNGKSIWDDYESVIDIMKKKK